MCTCTWYFYFGQKLVIELCCSYLACMFTLEVDVFTHLRSLLKSISASATVLKPFRIFARSPASVARYFRF